MTVGVRVGVPVGVRVGVRVGVALVADVGDNVGVKVRVGVRVGVAVDAIGQTSIHTAVVRPSEPPPTIWRTPACAALIAAIVHGIPFAGSVNHVKL